ncbi:hypothetical protein T440DRAFT_519773 [Plenodomus tracheiphilus IPT5]|uniref:Uncharacterized protein n=1 Tax=Plenodomus tracheiphilus IPT5 TaxID=1408161 RepID=A0A6A7AZ84_9PLEO|nr:hypothetical protein T440DRAFT_519773 [Plenodomus tracheiphilus IPT5]
MYYNTRALRKKCAVRQFASDARELTRYFIDRYTMRRTNRELRYDLMALRRDELRQRSALRRRKIQTTKFKVGTSIGNIDHRPKHYPTIADRQDDQLRRMLDRHQQGENCRITTCANTELPPERDQREHQIGLSLDQLCRMIPQINCALRCLMKLTHDLDYFEDLSDDVLRYLRQAAPALQDLGARALEVDWDWWTFRAVHDFLHREDEWGRLDEPLVSHRKILKEVADLVGLDLESEPLYPATEWTVLYEPKMFAPEIGGIEAMDETDYATARPYEPGRDQPTPSPQCRASIVASSSSQTHPAIISASNQPFSSVTPSFTQSNSSSTSPLTQSISSTFSLSTAKTWGTSASTIETPTAPLQRTAEAAEVTAGSNSNTASGSSAPRASEISPEIPKKSVVTTTSIKNIPNAPKVASAASTEAVDTCTGKASFLAFYANKNFKAALSKEADNLLSSISVKSVVSSHETGLLDKSCHWLINNRNAEWFPRDDIVLEDEVGDWLEKMIGISSNLQELRRDGDCQASNDKELVKLQTSIEKVQMTLEGKPVVMHKLGKAMSEYDTIRGGCPNMPP